MIPHPVLHHHGGETELASYSALMSMEAISFAGRQSCFRYKVVLGTRVEQGWLSTLVKKEGGSRLRLARIMSSRSPTFPYEYAKVQGRIHRR